MARPLTWLTWLLLGAGLSAGCTPDVLIARMDGIGGTGITYGGAPSGLADGGAPDDEGGAAGDASVPAAGAGGTPDEPPVQTSPLLADSVADFTLVQGERGWFYGFDTGTSETFALLTRTSVITAYVPASGDDWDCWTTEDTHWTQIFQLGAHPNGTDTTTPSVPVLERAVRRWVSTYAGPIRITGEMAKIDVTIGGSNGVNASVVVDGLELYTKLIGGDDGGGLSYEVRTTVQVGSNVDFVLDPHEGADHHDLSRFTAVIEIDQDSMGP
ncbi:MAG TPA: hypothetical protein VJN18_04130 [Polyangiaceae bacterium]|nr:hypothetical protein [Polyangiaceae bacterium]